jgi:YVTN family beta-propeller protein
MNGRLGRSTTERLRAGLYRGSATPVTSPTRRRWEVALLGLVLAMGGCAQVTPSVAPSPSAQTLGPSPSGGALAPSPSTGGASSAPSASAPATPAVRQTQSPAGAPFGSPLPGMPPILDPTNIYAADGAGNLSPAVRGDLPLIYVPNSGSSTVTEIDPSTYRVVRTFTVGRLPQHIVPSYDLRTLWVTSETGNSLTPIDPRTGLPGAAVPVDDPYNLYFTPDGRFAIVVAEARQRLDFRSPDSMRLVHALSVPCPGVDHGDFSANGQTFLVSCEFASQLLEIDVAGQRVVRLVSIPNNGQPQDVKLSPDGTVYYVSDLRTAGVWEVDATSLRILGFIPTGAGAHGLYVSRDARSLYVSNRDAGSVSVIDFATRRVSATWKLPGGGSPDMGNVSADGTVLWLSGRHNAEVYAIDTATGQLLARIPVGSGPHGLCVWPEPGRYSLGHTGILR